MLDCACLAGIIALRHFRRPEVEIIGENEVIVVRISYSPPENLFLTATAFSSGTRANASGDPPQSLLLHIRILLGSRHFARSRPFTT